MRQLGEQRLLTRAQLGAEAELAVAEFLHVLGFAICATNLRLGRLEVDVVARRGPLVVMTEVRTRGPGSYVGPFASVTWAKRTRLVSAARRLWGERRDRPWMRGVERLRIDVAAVSFGGRETRVEYAPGALA
ncbi:MAG TPA: YraN family protein [Polyangiaceae bacterium]|nr:YraN family protein [Polyangiaceae bacterium]